jgi:haloalkane dehalogenase
MSWDEVPPVTRSRFQAFRLAGVGETMVLDENIFIDQALRLTMLGGMSDADQAIYAAPYPTRDSRRPLLEWPRALPFDGEPADVAARVEA